MDRKRKLIFKNAIIILLCSELVSIFALHQVQSGFLFFLFQLFGILLPGMALATICDFSVKTDTEWIGISWFLGYFANLLEYLIVMLLHAQSAAWILLGLVAVCSLVYLWKSKKTDKELENDRVGSRILLVCGGIMFALSLVIYCGINRIPPATAESSINGDLLYWAGNTIELIKEFPPLDFRNYPTHYNYHYFFSMQLAFISMATGIRPVVLSVSFTLVQSILLRVYGGYLLLRKCTKNEKLRAWGMVLLFFVTGWEGGTTITYAEHLYVAGFGLEYGLAIFLFLLWLILDCYERKRFSRNDIFMFLTFFVLLGVKSTYASVMLCGFGILFLGWMLQRKFEKALSICLPILGLFAIGYFTVIRISGAGASGDILEGTMYDTWLSAPYQAIASIFPMFGNVFAIPIFYLYYMLIACPICFALGVYSIYTLCNRRKWELFDFAILGMLLISFLLTLQIVMAGISNRYFAMAAFPLSILWFFSVYERTAAVRGKEPLGLRRFWGVVISVFFVISLGGFGFKMVQAISYASTNYRTEITLDTASNTLMWTYVNQEQVEAYEWLRFHSDDTQLVATNIGGWTVGAFSERYVIHRGRKAALFTAETEESRKDILARWEDEGVRWVVYDKLTTSELLEIAMLTPAFENRSIVIYELN